MKKTFDKVVLISISGSAPTLVGLKGGNKYWECGRSYCEFDPDEDIIVREFSYESDGDLNKIYIDWDAERASDPQPIVARLGWISPNGDYFPCAYCAHQSLASYLSAKYLRHLGGKPDLLRHGWLEVAGGYAVRDVEGTWPAPMLDTFGKLVAAFAEAEAQGINFNESLLPNPERYPTQSWFTRPDEDGVLVKHLKEAYQLQTGEYPVGELITPLNYMDTLSQRVDQHPGD